MLVESDIIGQGSVEGVMKGKRYNRSMHCHKVMSEVLQRLRFEAFLDCLDDEDSDQVVAVATDMLNNFQTDSFHEEINGESFLDIKETYQKFIEEESKENPTFAFCSSYLEIIQTLLCFVR